MTDTAKDRKVLGRAIGQNQGVKFPIAPSYADMRAAELMVEEALSLNPGVEPNMAKMLLRETRRYKVAPISTNLVLSNLPGHVPGLSRSY